MNQRTNINWSIVRQRCRGALTATNGGQPVTFDWRVEDQRARLVWYIEGGIDNVILACQLAESTEVNEEFRKVWGEMILELAAAQEGSEAACA